MRKYILDFLLVLTLSVGVCLDFAKLGFNWNLFSDALLVIILAGSFWTNYEKDKIIKELKSLHNY